MKLRCCRDLVLSYFNTHFCCSTARHRTRRDGESRPTLARHRQIVRRHSGRRGNGRSQRKYIGNGDGSPGTRNDMETTVRKKDCFRKVVRPISSNRRRHISNRRHPTTRRGNLQSDCKEHCRSGKSQVEIESLRSVVLGLIASYPIHNDRRLCYCL